MPAETQVSIWLRRRSPHGRLSRFCFDLRHPRLSAANNPEKAMRAALSKTAIESQLTSRFGVDVFKLNDHGYGEVMSTGLPEIDALAGGFPRGAITEIYGSESSGRTSLMLSALAQATRHDEVCALVDTNDVLDPSSAVSAAVDLERLLWIRCAGNLEHSFKAIDLLLQGGGFGL